MQPLWKEGWLMDILNLRKLADEQRNLRAQQELAEEDPTNESFDDSDQDRLDELNNLAKQLRVDDIDECHDTLVNDNDSKEYADSKAYAMQYAEDTGAITHELQWPYDCIDWEQAATDLFSNWTTVEFEGNTYWWDQR
jgi:hypothetical protein